jgi:enoyl-CoA hydratase/carnithine racemase
MAAVGPLRAGRWSWSQTLTPAAALDVGLVDAVVPAERTEAVALDIAQTATRGTPLPYGRPTGAAAARTIAGLRRESGKASSRRSPAERRWR